jgi:hypothetical protein
VPIAAIFAPTGANGTIGTGAADLSGTVAGLPFGAIGTNGTRGEPTSWDADDWQAAFDERAAILEFDGGLPREDAERLAREEIERLRTGGE